ncbi:MAG: T9SS type A sorting domain-containing protein, partial [Tunicatimonas sp.]|uniref:T9SS type A sorting domain-containing protein n=1 Tax=Tunicatimonas sp. TaxID=1940096 RepID=UPI003C72FD69
STYLSVTFDQGVTWESYNLTDENTSDGWTSVSRILEGVAGQESVLFRIGIESHSTERYEGIAIDNMLVCSAGNIVSISDTTVIGGGSLSIPIQLDNPDIIEASYQVSSNNQEILADENLSVSGNTLQINSSTEAKGDAIITIFSPDACIAETSFTLTVDQITALDDQLDKSSQVQLHPNPSTGNYQIKSKEAIREVRVYSPTGQLLKQYTYLSDTNWELSIDVYGQPNGIYYLQVETDDNVLTRKVIKY